MLNRLFHKLKDVSPGIKASAAFLVASIITKGIAYITTPFYTRLLTAEEYGQVSIYQTWFQIFGILAMFCLSYGVFNNGMVDFPKKRDEYALSMLGLSNIITIVFAVLVFALYPLVQKVIHLDKNLIALMCVVFFFQPAYNFWYTKERYEYKYKKVVIWSILCAICSPLIAILCMTQFRYGNRFYSRIYGAEIPLILIYIGFYCYIFRKGKGKIDPAFWKTAIAFNFPLIPHYLSTYLLASSDKIMISYLISDTATAYYSVAHAVASVATIVWAAVNASLVPYTYEKCKERDYKSISVITLPVITVFAAACVFVIVLAPEVVAIMATKEYTEAIYVIPPIVGGVFFQVQYFIYTNIVYYYKKTKYVMLASVTSFGLNLILNFIFIRQYGYIAAGYTTLLSYLIQAIMDYYAMKIVVKETVYNMKYISTLSLSVIAIALFSNLVYDAPIIRYLLLGILLICSYIFRNKIVTALSVPRNSKNKNK